MHLSPDQWIVLQLGALSINATLVYTWLVMALLAGGACYLRRYLCPDGPPPLWQAFLETLIEGIQQQVSELAPLRPERYLPFVGTLFLFIATSNLLAVVPGFEPPTASLSTTAALALCVMLAVPMYGIRSRGLRGYLHEYIEPSPWLLPLHILSEFTRTLALAVRLFGNVLSEGVVGAILLSLAPLLFPILMQLLGLLTGLIQAYIFAVLAMVYIAAASQTHSH